MSADNKSGSKPLEPQHAVLLSGNGAYGAYEVGVLKALLHGISSATGRRPIEPEIYTGVSMGALSAAVMVANSDDSAFDAVQKLEEVWMEEICESFSGENGIYRWRANPFDYSRPVFYLPNPARPFLSLASDAAFLMREAAERAGRFFGAVGPRPSARGLQNGVFEIFDWSVFVDHTPLRKLIETTVDVAQIHKSETELRLMAANWQDGRPKVFTNRELTGEKGLRAIGASLAIPGVAPPEPVDVDHYVDGAVLTNQPLRPAIEARDRAHDEEGRERPLVVHAIYIDPEYSKNPLPPVRNTFSSIYRLYALAFARSVNADVERAERLNHSLQFLELLRDPISSSTAEGSGLEIMKLYKRLNRETAEGVQVVIHRYRSSKHISGMLEMFNFEGEKLRKLIDQGYADAQIHDCEESGCVRLDESFP